MKQYLFLFLFITFAFLGSNKAYADNDNVEQELAMRVQQAQVSGNDSEFYDAHKLFLNHLEQKETWDKYYRVWMSRVIYHQEQYLYISHMCLGFFYSGRNQPEMGETYFRKALQGIDADKEPVSVFNCYLSLSQVLSFNRPTEAMACLDSLPKQMLENPIYDSGVLGYRCIIASRLGDQKAFDQYFARYDSIRKNNPAGFNPANLYQVMVCYNLAKKDYKQALAWCDSTDVPMMANELRLDIYEKNGRLATCFQSRRTKG